MTLERLRQLCATYWNPIGVPMSNQPGVGDFPPMPADEYDRYLAALRDMTSKGVGEAELFSFLELVERDYLELDRPAGNKTAFIRAILAETDNTNSA